MNTITIIAASVLLTTAAHAEEKTMKLTPLQEHVIMGGGTEQPFANEYWNNHEAGIYVDRLSGEPLFSSTDKFDSASGWPSFTRPISDHNIVMKADTSHGMTRTEVKSASDAHLGHVFDDGPADQGGKRFCINSASLLFIPKAQLKEKGYGEYMKLFDHP